MFFIAGITGHVGGAAARRLLDEGHQVRALTRDPAKAEAWTRQGVDVRQGDLGDAGAVAEGLRGVEAAFLMLPPVMAPAPGFPETAALIASYREALRKATPPRLVALSSFGSHLSSGLGLITSTRLLEEGLKDAPFPIAFVRPGSFLENYTHSLAAAEATGFFDTFLAPTSRALPMVGSADIGAEVAKLIVHSQASRKIVEIGSPTSADDLARAMGDVVGRPVEARAIPRENWTAALQAIGLPPGRTAAYEEMQDGLNSGWIGFEGGAVEHVAATTTPAEVFAAAKGA